ncbi:MAG: hypothetical protein M2R45_03801 [Verrucomicrobia subdivision 3 bacterium]|nr:hypothetical protein [Limisphaerales bacterium]MCS1416758.1 hypothetical protein [Limisphaerales bacterium]
MAFTEDIAFSKAAAKIRDPLLDKSPFCHGNFWLSEIDQHNKDCHREMASHRPSYRPKARRRQR